MSVADLGWVVCSVLLGVWLQSTFGFPWGPLRNGLRRKR